MLRSPRWGGKAQVFQEKRIINGRHSVLLFYLPLALPFFLVFVALFVFIFVLLPFGLIRYAYERSRTRTGMKLERWASERTSRQVRPGSQQRSLSFANLVRCNCPNDLADQHEWPDP